MTFTEQSESSQGLRTMVITAVYMQDEGWIIGWTLEPFGAVVQERTLKKAKASMREVIPLLLEVYAEAGIDVMTVIKENIQYISTLEPIDVPPEIDRESITV